MSYKERQPKNCPKLKKSCQNVWGSISVTKAENSFRNSYIPPTSHIETAVETHNRPASFVCSRIAVSLMDERITAATFLYRHVHAVPLLTRTRGRAYVVKTQEAVSAHGSQQLPTYRTIWKAFRLYSHI